MGRVLLTVLLSSGCIPDLDRNPSDLGADADSRPWLPESGADLPKGDASIKDQGGDHRLCSTEHLHTASA